MITTAVSILRSQRSAAVSIGALGTSLSGNAGISLGACAAVPAAAPEEQINDANDALVDQFHQCRHDLAGELVAWEFHHQQLDRSEFHPHVPFRSIVTTAR